MVVRTPVTPPDTLLGTVTDPRAAAPYMRLQGPLSSASSGCADVRWLHVDACVSVMVQTGINVLDAGTRSPKF